MNRKRWIILSICIIFVALLSVMLYYLSLYKAETMIQNLVRKQSDGKIELKIKNVQLDITELAFTFNSPSFRTNDSIHNTTGYQVNADYLSFNVKSLLSVFTEGHFVVDSILVKSPRIQVIKYKQPKNKHISVPEEIKVVYNWLEKTLEIVNLNYLNISDAKFIIQNRLSNDSIPIELSKLNLTIKDVSKTKKKNQTKFLYARNIIFEIGEQDFSFPDGYHGLHFKKFRLETRRQMLKLDSCSIFALPNAESKSSFNIFLDSIQIKKLDFNSLAEKNLIKFDSAICYNPNVQMKLIYDKNIKKAQANKKEAYNKDSLLNKLGKLAGKLDMGYLTVKNAGVNVSVEKNDKKSIYSSQKLDFSLGGLKVDGDSETPIQLKSIKFNVQNYTGYLPDSLYFMKFDDISIVENKIQLHNFVIEPTRKNTDKVKRTVKVRIFELAKIDWMALLYDNKIVADHATIIEPTIHLILPAKEANSKKTIRANPFKILEKIKNKVQIRNWYIEKGNLAFNTINGPSIKLSACHLGINVDLLLAAENEIKLINALDTMWFENANYSDKNNKIGISKGSYSKKSSSLDFKLISYNSNNSDINAAINNLKLKGLGINSLNSISLDEISWQSANANINQLPARKKDTAQVEVDYTFSINKLQGNATKINFQSNNTKAELMLENISTGHIGIEKGKKPEISGLKLKGNNFRLNSANNLHLYASNLQFEDNASSSLQNIRCSFKLQNDSCSVFIPQFTYKLQMQNLIHAKLNIDLLEFTKPQIAFKKANTYALTYVESNVKKKTTEIPQFTISKLRIVNPEIKSLPTAIARKLSLKTGNSMYELTDITTENNNIVAKKLDCDVNNIEINTSNLKIIPQKPNANLKFLITDLEFNNERHNWSCLLKEINMSNFQLIPSSANSTTNNIQLKSIRLQNIALNNQVKNINDIININPDMKVSNTYVNYKDNKTIFNLYNFSASYKNKNIQLDSLLYSPTVNQYEYMKNRRYQKSYNSISIGKTIIANIDFVKLLNDTIFYAKKIELNQLYYHGYKDRRLEFQHGIIKPLPTEIFKKIPAKIQIDSLILRNASVKYQEFVAKTNQFGEIKLYNMRGAIANIKTYNYTKKDSLKFNIAANFMNITNLKVKYDQSYTDTLSTFHLKVIVSKTDLTKLNPILRPFASAEIVSGQLDTLRMSVVGRKYVAYGVMKMYYDKLNIRYLDKVNEKKPSVIGNAISFMANVILRQKNRYGINEVYAERNPEIEFLNYWIRILTGGVLTNTGVKSNNAQQQKYYKSIKKHKVPPIPDIPVNY